MGKTQKKNSKGRLDRYYYLAKEKGYRARSSFKIIQINEKYGHFLEKSKVVIDLCAAPGSWCQVASNLCPVNSLIIGVDIVPMKPMPNVITFQSDITTEDCRSRLRGYMKTWKADTVMHDGAPNVGLGWVQDAFTQSQLTLQALKLAAENLVAGGTFVTKVFRSKDYNKLMWVFQQLFDKVEATKPPASRNVSAEIFVVCKGFKAPKKLDPRLLDPKEVFEELADGPQNNEAKVFNPEKKRRKRDGYEEGDYLQFKTVPVMEFVREDDPIDVLGSTNQLVIDEEDPDWSIVRKMRKTTPELLECFKDLKVLGKKDFRNILRWRKTARTLLKLDEEEKVEVEVEELDEEALIDKELDEVKKRQLLKQKRERRRKNEMKQKEIMRMQMNMLTPMDIGIEAGESGRESLFNLKTAEKTGQLGDLAKGKRRMIFDKEELAVDNDIHIASDAEADSDEEFDDLAGQLDGMYNAYQERRSERDAKFRAKKARGDADDEKWDGIQDKKSDDESEEEAKDYQEESESDLDSDDDEAINNLIAKLKSEKAGVLSKKADMLFNDPIFAGVEAELSAPASKKTQTPKTNSVESPDESTTASLSDGDYDSSDNEDKIEYVGRADNDDMDVDDSDLDDNVNLRNHQKEVDLATAQAMTLAHQIALGQKTKHDLVDDGFNRYSFNDVDGLPAWFLDDEKQHSKINKPITKEAALAIKEKMKQLNARPIKKVAEAKGRKKMRALARLEKLKKKSDIINDDNDKSEKDKAEEISKLMRKLTKKQKTKPKVTYVFAKGANRGLSGRPKGIKGKYRMVDGVMKNERRAIRRIAKKHKK
ncbi:CYFA0S06e04236g1_1 [Cyberlindnera fabianii]|uniref:AdoMet-dependent rRNA methyltransferase SPB1 n=1 Tax=Cyberlindnera fabianii TaxID=36022 RepID=A0A061B0P8_CYBFA|nr:AdoMet-dependent rRNA methyltransferase SPB1 [Cyberlindnera fabianii]CDR41222.1 CYFA0S06e04236g1_1 [Cyberlindnera fabianii]